MTQKAGVFGFKQGDEDAIVPPSGEYNLMVKSSALPGNTGNTNAYIQFPDGTKLPLAGVLAAQAKGGTVTLVAGTAAVAFVTPFSDALYQIGFGGNGDETLRWSAQLAGGFTVTSGDGASTSSVHWTATKFGNA